jgi:hypothetical protein
MLLQVQAVYSKQVAVEEAVRQLVVLAVVQLVVLAVQTPLDRQRAQTRLAVAVAQAQVQAVTAVQGLSTFVSKHEKTIFFSCWYATVRFNASHKYLESKPKHFCIVKFTCM